MNRRTFLQTAGAAPSPRAFPRHCHSRIVHCKVGLIAMSDVSPKQKSPSILPTFLTTVGLGVAAGVAGTMFMLPYATSMLVQKSAEASLVEALC